MNKYYEPQPIPEQQETIAPPELGAWLMCKATAEKTHDNETENCTIWKRRQMVPKKMMFIGVRQVREGLMVDDEKIYHDADGVDVDIDYFRSFHATRFITVWLFVATAHSNPVHVLPADASEVTTD